MIKKSTMAIVLITAILYLLFGLLFLTSVSDIVVCYLIYALYFFVLFMLMYQLKKRIAAIWKMSGDELKDAIIVKLKLKKMIALYIIGTIVCLFASVSFISNQLVYWKLDNFPNTNLTEEQKEKRKEFLTTALEKTYGIGMTGHGIQLPGITIKPYKIYQLQKHISSEDLELLSDMFISRFFDNGRQDSIILPIIFLFAMRGEEAIAVFENRIINSSLSEAKKTIMLTDYDYSGLGTMKTLSTARNTFWLEYHKYKEKDAAR